MVLDVLRWLPGFKTRVTVRGANRASSQGWPSGPCQRLVLKLSTIDKRVTATVLLKSGPLYTSGCTLAHLNFSVASPFARRHLMLVSCRCQTAPARTFHQGVLQPKPTSATANLHHVLSCLQINTECLRTAQAEPIVVDFIAKPQHRSSTSQQVLAFYFFSVSLSLDFSRHEDEPC